MNIITINSWNSTGAAHSMGFQCMSSLGSAAAGFEASKCAKGQFEIIELNLNFKFSQRRN